MKYRKTTLLWMAAGVIALLTACSASVTYTKTVDNPLPPGPATTITLSPKSGRVAPGAGFSFAATVQNAPDANSSYRLTVDEGISGGTLDPYTGQYLAPWVPGTYHVTATGFRGSQRHGPWHRDGDGEWQSDRPQQVGPSGQPRWAYGHTASGWPDPDRRRLSARLCVVFQQHPPL